MKKNCIVITCMEDNEPQFGWINDVIVSEEQNIILEITTCSIVCYSDHYHSWVIEKTNQHSYLMHNNLITQQIFIPRHANVNTYFVTLKYAVL